MKIILVLGVLHFACPGTIKIGRTGAKSSVLQVRGFHIPSPTKDGVTKALLVPSKHTR